MVDGPGVRYGRLWVSQSLTSVAVRKLRLSEENVACVDARVIRRLFLCVTWAFTGHLR
jgi:hypothetical protein